MFFFFLLYITYHTLKTRPSRPSRCLLMPICLVLLLVHPLPCLRYEMAENRQALFQQKRLMLFHCNGSTIIIIAISSQWTCGKRSQVVANSCKLADLQIGRNHTKLLGQCSILDRSDKLFLAVGFSEAHCTNGFIRLLFRQIMVEWQSQINSLSL